MRAELEKQLEEALKKCLVIDEEDRRFWLSNMGSMPERVLNDVLHIVNEKNNYSDKYVEAALANDPDNNYLMELKSRIKKIKEQAFKMDEAQEKGKAEENLSKLLEDL